jgi:DNA polymerase
MLNEGVGFFRAAFGDKAMQTLSDLIRAVIVPAKDHVYVGADLNAIECRVLNWLAGEQWVMALFARGESPYIRMAEGIFEKKGLSKKGTPFEYDIGKRSELGFGFGMGAAKFQGSVYTETSKKGEGVWLDDDLAEKAKTVYRETHPNVVAFWYATEAAAVNAVRNPGQLFPVAGGRVLWGMSADRVYLVCKLPSGRLLRYYTPSVVQATSTRCKAPDCPHVLKNDVELCPKKRAKTELHYWASAGKGAIRTGCNGFLGEYRTWGGELVENTVQTAAREFMVVGMERAEMSGKFPLVLHNYDELLAEVPLTGDVGLRLPELIGMMTKDLPAWTAGCPVLAEGFIGKRYRK